ncbi:hypothetical protein AYO47_04815 [Planctomyces sp. SCGC AG-212-M04]|nr:hypothetical protein AYO47_04815 [Planctomyces sp. SCGC AG-212-M04]
MSSRPHPAGRVHRASTAKQAAAEHQPDGYRRLQDLLHEDTVQGALRRALDSIEGSNLDLARCALIEPKHLKDFYWGDADLAGEEIDRLARVLHLQLVSSDH